MSASMRNSGLFLLVLFAVQHSTWALCSLYELECCTSLFSSMISPYGIVLSESKVALACTMREEMEECMDLILDQCRKDEDLKNIEETANKTKLFMSEICSPSSDFMMNLMVHEKCILNSSQSFQTCYNKTVVPRSSETTDDKMKKECCEYKELRNCAVETVEKACGPASSQLVHEEVLHMNGAVMEWECIDVFDRCSSAAMLASSSALALLFSVAILKMLS